VNDMPSDLFDRVDRVVALANKRKMGSADDMRRSQYQLIGNCRFSSRDLQDRHIETGTSRRAGKWR